MDYDTIKMAETFFLEKNPEFAETMYNTEMGFTLPEIYTFMQAYADQEHQRKLKEPINKILDLIVDLEIGVDNELSAVLTRLYKIHNKLKQ